MSMITSSQLHCEVLPNFMICGTKMACHSVQFALSRSWTSSIQMIKQSLRLEPPAMMTLHETGIR